MRTEPFTRQCNFCLEYLIPDKHKFYTCIGCGADLVPPRVSPLPYQKEPGTVPCHYCGRQMQPMADGGHECPLCKSQVYGPQKETRAQITRVVLACARNDSTSNPTIRPASHGGGGSKSKGGGKKQLMQKASRKAIYNDLCKDDRRAPWIKREK